jgi:hypothetical protein
VRGFVVAAAFVATGFAGAQSAARTVEGRVQRPGASSTKAPVPVAGLQVVLHRVGSDRAGPLDSIRSDASGRFRFRYSLSGQPEALYFVSATYRGIAYFSSPLRSAVVRGGDADLVVYDTTSDSKSLHVQGRHLVVSAPRDGMREIAEIFEIENETNFTVVARDSTNPLWATHFPAEAESLSVAPGDLGAGAVSFRNGRGELYAPISPGVRQLVVTYRLRVGAFPLVLPVEFPVAIFEVLLEEPRAVAEGAGLAETAPAAIDGRNFRRFLSRAVPPASVVRVRAPAAVGTESQTALKVLAVVVALILGGALLLWRARNRPVPVAPLSSGDQLVAELAALDARFEKDASADAAARDRYHQARTALKQKIASALAGESTHS